MLTRYILRLIRKVGPAIYWIIMIAVAALKLANEAIFYRCSEIIHINSKLKRIDLFIFRIERRRFAAAR